MTISTTRGIDRRTLARTATAGLLGGMLAPFAASAAPGGFSLSVVPGVVTAAADILRKEYVDPAAANRLADMLIESLKVGAYNAVQSPTELAARLTADLRGATNDLHMQVSYDPPNPAQDTARDLPEDEHCQEHSADCTEDSGRERLRRRRDTNITEPIDDAAEGEGRENYRNTIKRRMVRRRHVLHTASTQRQCTERDG